MQLGLLQFLPGALALLLQGCFLVTILNRLSTAMLLAAQTSTFPPLVLSWRIISTSVDDFPVPGGPWSKNCEK